MSREGMEAIAGYVRMNDAGSECSLPRPTMDLHHETSDLDHILKDMPSRTVGRKQGARLARLKSQVHENVTVDGGSQLEPDDVYLDEMFNEITAQEIVDDSAIKDLPVSMMHKREIRNKAKDNERIARKKQISKLAILKFEIALSWRHFKTRFYRFIVTSGKLWHNHLKVIEGDFGSGVVSYFAFLREIFILSLVSFLFTFVFISVPQLFDQPEVPTCQFTGEEILTGSNCLTNTLMYQGYYTNTTINALGNAFYDMPTAYLLTLFVYFLFCLVWLVHVTSSLFKDNYIDAKEEYTHFSNRIFCAWDFGITSKSMATIRHRTIVTELEEALSEHRRQGYHRDPCVKCELFMLRIISWSFYFGLMSVAVAAVYFLNKTLICKIISQTGDSPIFQDIALPVMVSAINLIMPYIIDWMTRLEKYKYPRHRLYISVSRNFLFKMGLLGVIGAFWTSNNVQRCNENQNNTICWETNMGQEIYRLVVIDFIFSLLFSTLCAEFIAKWISKKRGTKEPEFLIANNAMDLIYGQTLCWIGMYFSPFLPLVNVIKYFILFYIKRFSVVNNCRPSTRRWRAAQSRTLFNAAQLASFLLSTIFVAYVIVNELPSKNCGPFRGQSRAYDVIVAKVNDLAAQTSGDWIATIISIVTNVWVLDSVAISLLILVILKKNETRGLESIAKSLEEQIALEGRDKMMLLKQLQRQYRRQGQMQDKNSEITDPIALCGGQEGLRPQSDCVTREDFDDITERPDQ